MQSPSILRIVLAEDDPDIVRLLEARLPSRGYEVTATRDGREALALVSELLPDAVVLDWLMPGVDGAEVCARLRANPRTADIPIVLLTAKATDSDRESGLSAGAGAYLTKPFLIEELDETLRRITGRVRP